jgi:pimeloyl-ACP methyl ester carboxylesterase
VSTSVAGSTVIVDGLAVHQRDAVKVGTSPVPTVVFVHGAADRGAAFARVGRHLPGAHLVRYDRRGYGRSVTARPPQVTTQTALLASQVDDLVAVIAATADDGPVVVVGHSLGGLVALGAAVRVPEVIRAVVAYEPPTPWESWWGGGQAGSSARAAAASADQADPATQGAMAMEAFLRRMIGDDRWEALGPRVQKARHAEGPALLADLEAARGASHLELGALTLPVVFGVGTQTSERHKRAVDHLAALIDGAEVVVIDGADHGAHMSHPAEMASLVDVAVGRLSW